MTSTIVHVLACIGVLVHSTGIDDICIHLRVGLCVYVKPEKIDNKCENTAYTEEKTTTI